MLESKWISLNRNNNEKNSYGDEFLLCIKVCLFYRFIYKIYRGSKLIRKID